MVGLMDFDPTETPSARDRFDRLYDILKSRICLLDYPPGTRLSEEALAAEFGTSRTPLRRVLVRLEGEGLLQSVHGVGTFVTDADIETLGQTYQLRMELAELLGVLSPNPPNPVLWNRLASLSTEIRQLADNPDARRFGQLNLEFFDEFYRITANEPLREICDRLFVQTSRIWMKSMGAERIDVATEAAIFADEIDDILRALEIGDVRSAALLHRTHISMSFIRMRLAARTT
ncbi:GntR family transcriptional regulator [Gemmobacter lanyuensis]|uniref:GntR family transcriptional regulator n=1 Tax=Gemmobacter lanyuensis TaxID=1054497 RepID=A0A918J1W0_9RHOB|nr:GntR family transcriptional regulator [Gemmobacter lanyuensis]GGW43567.1 GntR family transcriptional regulator [Gemmobacter lanyuensis]